MREKKGEKKIGKWQFYKSFRKLNYPKEILELGGKQNINGRNNIELRHLILIFLFI